jgi:hypothetical protein
MPETKTNENKNTASPTIASQLLYEVFNILFIVFYLFIGIWILYMKIVWNDLLNARFTRQEFFKYIGRTNNPSIFNAISDITHILRTGKIDSLNPNSTNIPCQTVPSLEYSIDNKSMYKHLYNDNHSFISDLLNQFREKSKNGSQVVYENNYRNVFNRIGFYYFSEIYYVIYFAASIFYDMSMPDIITILVGPILLPIINLFCGLILFFLFPITLFTALYEEFGLLSGYFLTIISILFFFIFGAFFIPIFQFYFLIRTLKSMFLNIKQYSNDAIISSTETPIIQGTKITEPISSQEDLNKNVSTQPNTNISSEVKDLPSSNPDIKIGGGSGKTYTYMNYVKDITVSNGWLQYFILFIIILKSFGINQIFGTCLTGIVVLFMIYMGVKYKRIFFKPYDEVKALRHNWLPIVEPIMVNNVESVSNTFNTAAVAVKGVKNVAEKMITKALNTSGVK